MIIILIKRNIANIHSFQPNIDISIQFYIKIPIRRTITENTASGFSAITAAINLVFGNY
ncbi:hypothetical protein Phage132_248 [Escherichia phage 132]|nr:hypothetical protein Phage132_248 [Escherichia phage 132]